MIIFLQPLSPSSPLPSCIGEKGRGLLEIIQLGIPTPPGFIIPYGAVNTEELILNSVERLKMSIGLRPEENLFVSVRSSPEVSMPGMLNTVLNVDSSKDLLTTIERVKSSWDNPRARYYRQLKSIEHESRLAVIVQQMVYGNTEGDSGAGVFLTRNSFTNKPGLEGEYRSNSQGDVIMSGSTSPTVLQHLKTSTPHIYRSLESVSQKLEAYYKEAREVEFTFQKGELYILQCRRFLTLTEGSIVTVADGAEPLARGLGASPGVATGFIATTLEEVKRFNTLSQRAILLRPETSVEDIEAINLAEGVITLVGGVLSHAAVVTRSMGKPCVTNCSNLHLVGGELVTIDGFTGNVFLGQPRTQRNN